MGKVLLTNQTQWNHKLKKSFYENGFQENGKVIEDGLYLTTYSKLNIKTYNLYQEVNGFVACAGTVIYKGKIGKEALGELFRDLESRTLTEVRQNLLGCYVIVYKRNHQIKIFVDETGTYAFYYFKNVEGNYLFTNTYYHIEKMVKQPVDRLSFLEWVLESSILDNRTPYEKIYRILGSEMVVIDTKSNHIVIKPVELNCYCLKEKTLDGIANCINVCAQKILSAARNALISPHLFMTGGVDSRLLLANYLKIGEEPVLTSWFNAPITMNSKQEDLLSVKKIADKMNLEFLPVDVLEEKIDDVEGFYFLCEKLGEYALIYGGNVKWHNILQSFNIQYADYGFFGETLKGWKELDGLGEKKVDMDWFVRMYMNRLYYRNSERDVSYYKQLYARIYEEFTDIAKKNNIGVNSMSCKDCMALYYWYRLHADTVRYQYANVYCYAFPLYAQKEIADYINDIPYELKEHEKLNLRMEQLLMEQLLEIPFFSHCQYMKYDKKKMELRAKMPRTVSSYIIRLFKKNKTMKGVVDSLLKVKRKNTDEKKNEYIDRYIENLKRSKAFLKLCIYIDKYSISYIPALIKLTQLCTMTDRLLESDVEEE